MHYFIQELDYALIKLDESLKKNLESIGVTPLEADGDKLPTVSINDHVYIFQHPAGLDQHFSQDSVKCINGPFLEYYADTSVGSSGAPVLVYVPPKLKLVALHSKGVYSYPINHNKGILLCDILHHLQTGKGKVFLFFNSVNYLRVGTLNIESLSGLLK